MGRIRERNNIHRGLKGGVSKTRCTEKTSMSNRVGRSFEPRLNLIDYYVSNHDDDVFDDCL